MISLRCVGHVFGNDRSLDRVVYNRGALYTLFASHRVAVTQSRAYIIIIFSRQLSARHWVTQLPNF